ncbi:MAG: hypothetical protein AAF170_07025 [Bacteroidota bacterium]
MRTSHQSLLVLLALLMSMALAPTVDAQRRGSSLRYTLRIGKVKVLYARSAVIGTAHTRRPGRTQYIPITLSGVSLVDGSGGGGGCGTEDPVCDGELTGSDPEDNPNAAVSECLKLIEIKMSTVLAAAAASSPPDEITIEVGAVEPSTDCMTD